MLQGKQNESYNLSKTLADNVLLSSGGRLKSDTLTVQDIEINGSHFKL